MKQYEVFQMKFCGKEMAEDQVNVPVKAEFTLGGKTTEVRGFCTGEGEKKWNVRRPCFAFWDKLDDILIRLNNLGIEADLILFHPYDCWGFSELSMEKAKTYLEYVVRRLAAFPNIWWSLANEYDLMDYTEGEWKEFAAFIGEMDPWGHLLSNHNFVHPWDFADKNTTHCCLQSSDAVKIPDFLKKYEKPVMYDEVGYEGNIPYNWGNLSAFEEVNRFWKIFCYGGYATHGETFMEKMDGSQVLWWSKGGTLKGESPKRIGFMKELAYSLPAPMTFYEARQVPETQEELRKLVDSGQPGISDNSVFRCMCRITESEFEHMREFMSQPVLHHGDQVFLAYLGDACTICGMMELPQTGKYRVDVIDVWEMTRKTVLEDVNGPVQVPLPGKTGMAVLAVKTGE